MNNKPVKIIGFDLGHGEISLANIQANQNDREPPKAMLLHRQRYANLRRSLIILVREPSLDKTGIFVKW